MDRTLYAMLADLVVLMHTAIVLFNVGSALLIALGGLRGWQWVRHFGFRATHLLLILFICLQTLLGELCPLTHLENTLRQKAGEAPYPGDFLGYWAHELIYINLPWWGFILLYTGFALFVATLFIWVPPRYPWRKTPKTAEPTDGPGRKPPGEG